MWPRFLRLLQTGEPSPERSPSALAVISGQIHRDSQEPGLDPALAPETSQLLVCAEEALLGERIGCVGILQ